jgi:hypothetical protein
MATRDPNAGQSAGGVPPISKSFAVTILVALALLMVLRKTFGSIRLEVGSS